MPTQTFRTSKSSSTAYVEREIAAQPLGANAAERPRIQPSQEAGDIVADHWSRRGRHRRREAAAVVAGSRERVRRLSDSRPPYLSLYLAGTAAFGEFREENDSLPQLMHLS